MISLHIFQTNYTNLVYSYTIFLNILPSITSFLILFSIFILNIYSIIVNTSTKHVLLNNSKVIFLNYIFVLIILYGFKLISYFWINNLNILLDIPFTRQISTNSIIISTNVFSDTIVFLCILTTFISGVYLGERHLFLNNFNLFYFLLFIVFTINMVYTTNLLIMFIFFEFIFLPSLYFVLVLGYSKKVDKTIRYLLIWTLTGSFLAACGLLYLYSIVGTTTLTNLYWIKFSTIEKHVLFFCFFVGFGIKLPLWPFHYWLTKVHVEAPTGFSIFLSGYLVKTAFFCLTYFCILFKEVSIMLVVLSIVFFGVVDASIRMWTATDIKRLIAFATIQEMNLIIGLFALLTNTNFQMVNIFLLVHGMLSALLFFLIDQIQKRYQTRNLVEMSGLATFTVILHVVIWLSILIFRGFPTFVKFFIEWEILAILIQNFSIWGFVLFLLLSVFSVLGFCRIWFMVLYGQPSTQLVVPTDMLKKDIFLASFLISGLTALSSLIIFF